MTYKAYRVVWSGIPSIETYVAAENVGFAKTFLMCEIKKSDFTLQYTEISARRAREFDNLAAACGQLKTLGQKDAATGEVSGCCEAEAR